jgi:hypothetical protein
MGLDPALRFSQDLPPFCEVFLDWSSFNIPFGIGLYGPQSVFMFWDYLLFLARSLIVTIMASLIVKASILTSLLWRKSRDSYNKSSAGSIYP